MAFRQALNMVARPREHLDDRDSGVCPAITNVTGLPQPAGDAVHHPEYADQELTVDVDGAKAILDGRRLHLGRRRR